MKNTKSIVASSLLPDSGPVPYVTARSGNNGVASYVSCPDDWLDAGDCILIGGKTGVVTYQPKDFCSNDSHNIALYVRNSKGRNINCQLFLVAVLRKVIAARYTWSDSVSMARMKKETLPLPTIQNGDIDWGYMEAYIGQVRGQAASRYSYLERLAHIEARALDSTRWKRFVIGGTHGLFRIEKGTRLTRADMLDGDTPFIGASTANNGVTGHVGNTAHIHPGNVITVAYNGQKATGKAFYQPRPFWASDDVHVLYPRFELNIWRALFLLPIFRIIGERYAFEDKWKVEYMERDSLPLPVANDGMPDWNYMEQYIRYLYEEQSATAERYSKLFDHDVGIGFNNTIVVEYDQSHQT